MFRRVTRTELAQWLFRGDKDRAGPMIVQGVTRTGPPSGYSGGDKDRAGPVVVQGVTRTELAQ